MLILSRKANQSIMVGEDIELAVLEIKGDHVKLGIKAPRSVAVYRSEIFAEIQAENQKATRVQINPEQLRNLKPIFKKK